MRVAPHQWSPWSIYFLLLPQSLLSFVSAFEAGSRWGQATVVIKDALFVFGGKIDQFNQFSYTSAPNTNEIILLSLSSPFLCNSPSWELVSGATNQSTSQGPAVAWSTLSALNNTEVLLFGGELGVNSPTSSGEAQLLDVYSRLEPNWTTLLNSSLDQPPSRIRHSSVTSTIGLVFIFGGERPDGSNIAFSDHFYFDPTSLSFTYLPSAGAPPDIYGHASIILADGRILVFGGFSPSSGSLLPFSTIWILDTTDPTFSWTAVQTAVTSLPSPRVAFAAVLIAEGKIIIHGGSDPSFQMNNFADGWILDTTQSPMVWTAVVGLTELGGRRDHFAVSSGDQVIFGFGYADNGPAPAPLHVYNITSGTFQPGYNPPPVTSLPPQTLPPPTPTSTGTDTFTSRPFSSTEGVHPTSTFDPQNPGNGTGIPPAGNDNSASTTAIAVGTSLGVLSLLAIVIGGAYYIHKRHSRADEDGHFVVLDNDDGSEHLGSHIPVAGMAEVDHPSHGHHRLLNSLGISGALAMASRMRSVRSATTQRRDMLADEDTRSLREWYNSQRRDGSGNSSWSLLGILGGGRLGRSREGSTKSRGTGGLRTPWREKTDPFSDGAAVSRDEETGFIGAAAVGPFGSRPHSRREFSYTSHVSSMSYRDPFMDTAHEEFEPSDLYQNHSTTDVGDTIGDDNQPTIRHVPALAPLQTLAPPLSQQLGHPLSPLSEHTSQSTLPHNFSSSGSSQAHSGENIFSPISALSRATSRTESTLPPTTPSAKSVSTSYFRPSSDAALVTPMQPMRRSDSWWSRFSRSSLLDRRSHDTTSKQTYDIRDPTPAPKLTAIEEGSLRSAPTPSQHTPPDTSPGSAEQDKKLQIPSPQANKSASAGGVYAATGHGKSTSSLRTADSEAIERMAGTMDVIQRVKSRSQWGSGSTSSQGGLSIDTHGSISEVGDNQSLQGSLSEAERGHITDDLMMFASPVEEQGTTPRVGSSRLASLPPARRFAPVITPPADPADAKKNENKVTARIQEFERRMSQSQATLPPPTNTKQREERPRKQTVDYGLVPRASLFVANPDHRLSTRSDDS